jgi:hypothetical protein
MKGKTPTIMQGHAFSPGSRVRLTLSSRHSPLMHHPVGSDPERLRLPICTAMEAAQIPNCLKSDLHLNAGLSSVRGNAPPLNVADERRALVRPDQNLVTALECSRRRREKANKKCLTTRLSIVLGFPVEQVASCAEL